MIRNKRRLNFFSFIGTDNMITMGENKTFNLDDNRLYKIVDTKIIDKISYIPSARINTVSYNDMNRVSAT